MGSWIERGLLIAVGAAWIVLTVAIIGAFAIRDKNRRRAWLSRDWAGAGWLLFTRGLPGALFVLAGLAGDRNFIWAAAAALLAGFALGPAVRRYFGWGSSL